MRCCIGNRLTMHIKSILPFKNMRGYKFWYILWFFVFVLLCVCVFLSHLNADESGVIPVESLHVLCAIVPFRDAFEELVEFVPHMSEFWNRQGVRFHIAIINQADAYRFNRGALLNVGFKIVTEKHADCDYVALHDVDLLPLNLQISYSYPGDTAFHVSPPTLHPYYHKPTYPGGILLLSKTKFIELNGLSSKYWGWGGEDSEFFSRLIDQSVEVTRPGNMSTNHTNSFRHIHRLSRIRDKKVCSSQKKWYGIDRETGLNNTDFRITSSRSLTVDGFPFSLYNVNLTCNFNLTPWCDC